MNYYGHLAILDNYKVGFLSSQKCPAEVILKSYDWARQQRQKGNCIVCSNHSQIEKDVFEILIKGRQPLILVLARGMKTRWEPAIQNAVEEKRLLIVTSFEPGTRRITRETARKRNQKIIELSDRIIVGYVTEGGQLDDLIKGKEYEQL